MAEKGEENVVDKQSLEDTDNHDELLQTQETLSEQNLNFDTDDEDTHKYPSRTRKLTVKGQLLKIEKLKCEFNKCLNKWRKQCNRLRILITDRSDMEIMKFERGILEDLMSDLRSTFNCIDGNEDSNEDYLQFRREISERFDFVEIEHMSLIRSACDTIREGEQESHGISSESSKCGRTCSTGTRSSHRSGSHRSRCSSHSSKSSVETLLEAAALKAKLKFIDIEAQRSADLEKIKTMKAIEIARAKIETLDKIEGTDNASAIDDVKYLMSGVCAPNMLTDFLNTLESQSQVQPVPYVESSIEPSFSSDVNTQLKSCANSDPHVIQPDSVPPHSTNVSVLPNLPCSYTQPSQSFSMESVIPSNPTSILNPNANGFVPQHSIPPPSQNTSLVWSHQYLPPAATSQQYVLPAATSQQYLLPAATSHQYLPPATTSLQYLPPAAINYQHQPSTQIPPSHQHQQPATHQPPAASSSIPPQTNVTSSYSNLPVSEQLGLVDTASRPQNLEQGLLTLANSLAQQMSLSRLPPPEPSVFYGDPLKYPGWKVAFQALIEQRQIPDTERIHYLKKYIGGPVKDVIENYFLVTTSDSFEEAKGLLDQRYGDPFVISNAFRNKLENWPKIASRDSSSLQKFSDFLRQCYTAMRSIGNLDVLNDSRENQKMLSRLPDWIVVRWGRVVVQKKEDSNQYPTFKDFMDFISKEAKIACDPVISIQAIKSEQTQHGLHETEKSSTQSKKPTRYRNSVSSFPDKRRTCATLATTRTGKSCILCNGEHYLNNCRDFLSKDIDERKKYAKDRNLCFGCLNVGHISKNCERRLKCKTCGRNHPTSLHGDVRKPDSSDNSKENRSENSVHELQPLPSHTGKIESTSMLSHNSVTNKTSMIVPVYVSHCDNPNEERLVYALLDTQSDTTFILEDTYRELGLSGTKVKLLLSTMYAENQVVESHKVKGLVVRGFNTDLKISLPDTYTRNIMPANRSHIPTPDVANSWSYLKPIASEIMPLQSCEIGLLIGYNCARALIPRDVIASEDEGPYGQRTDLGWSIVGVTDRTCQDEHDMISTSHRIVTCEVHPSIVNPDVQGPNHVMFSLRTKIKELINPEILSQMFELDFIEHSDCMKPMSRDDHKFLTILQDGIHFVDGHYEMPLPFRENLPYLPNNRSIAEQRLKHLKVKLDRDETYKLHYVNFMKDMIQKGFAEKVPKEELTCTDGHSWYIPHHGVLNPQKPNKLRVVFDCSAKYEGQSLNDHLLQGPDLTNTLVGVLCRFRKEPIAIVCDIEQMFHQFKVNVEHRNYLRFLWWENGKTSTLPTEYRMCVHLFGAASSPGCANFGLKQTASDYESEFGTDIANFVRHNFYVDDGLKSVSTISDAVTLIQKSKEMCKKSGLHLHKFLSNSKEVLENIPQAERAKVLENVDILHDKLPVEKTLGIQWCIESDSFQFRIVLNDRPLTRRGILSTLSSVYDPLGLISPFILLGKQILQEMCRNQIDWDSPIPDVLRAQWEKWRRDLHQLKSLQVARCYKPKNFGKVTTAEIHHFSDASTTGYGQCSYIRLVDEKENIHCSLIMAKSRVAPIKSKTIPRLELTAAVVSVKMNLLLRSELDYPNLAEWFWTDSSVVLGYIANNTRRFHVFVANRVQQIRDVSEPYQWHYVSSSDNPADITSRGAKAEELVNQAKWFSGPEFLWTINPFANCDKTHPDIADDDPEVKRCQTLKTESTVCDSSLLDYLNRFSDWTRLKRVITWCLRFISHTLNRIRKRTSTSQLPVQENVIPEKELSVDELCHAENRIIGLLQKDFFKKEIETLQQNECETSKVHVTKRRQVKPDSPIYRLDPFVDESSLLRVGGRLRCGNFNRDLTHPIILPRKSHITNLLIHHFHKRIQHQGRGMTTNEIRANGYWIIGCSSAVYSQISKCVKCRRMRVSTQVQRMSDLPADRLSEEAPFTYSAVDFFGPWYIKEGRKELKRYGVLFTCMACRAVHLETACSLDTSSFINSLRRFISIRGPIRQLRCDRGTNFVGAEHELQDAIKEFDDQQLQRYLTNEGCDFVTFKMNVPSASHMGGVWERQIRSVRNVLSSLLGQSGSHLDDESLRTFMCEAAAIVNSRPLSITNIHDPKSLEPLTPNHLLTMKSKVILPPPGQFQREDLYSRRRWRRVQYLTNEFWNRWRKEFLNTLQIRKKWFSSKRDMTVGDIVLIKDENLPRNMWRLGRIHECFPDDDGHVRKVKLATATSSLDKCGKRLEPTTYLERPIHKLVLLHESETKEFPVEEPY